MNELNPGVDFVIPETAGSPTPDGFTRYTYLVFSKTDGRFLYESPIFCKDWSTFYAWKMWATENDNNYYYEM
jgi:hypothetical protein